MASEAEVGRVDGCECAARFADRFLPAWLEVALPPGTDSAPVVEELPDKGDPATTLAQARTAFMLAHLGTLTGNARLTVAARRVAGFVTRYLQDEDGGCRYAVNPDGSWIGTDEATLRRTYDQTFVLLALVTLRHADPTAVSQEQVNQCWSFVETVLTDRANAALWEDDAMAARGPQPGDLRAQNPHMHMLEAVLQCLELTGDAVWADRARVLVAAGARFFVDPATGAVREFVGHDLSPIDTPPGDRREPGHQYEWAWLLLRYSELTGDSSPRSLVGPMTDFAATHGWVEQGPMAGALHDALRADGRVLEASHLLWPLTEAGKYFAAIARTTGDEGAAQKVRDIADLIFGRFFARDGKPAWVNQFDSNGNVIWDAGLSRLLYHVAIFVSEGAAAGLWPLTAPDDGSREGGAHTQ
ncbi:mannose-6-phosphate isomerase [Aliiruegeria haliotis]|uniref:Mannose-6-phosphate isomerase n=1 Tax=Aliiruegeria haliotis TaxID=1280846 RepID=A0A2T0RZD6_9RHOB|nr:AGE family epimerase/isomerase [Aliiruegeria haliotis]PRY26546.1 mannose-6-phosphate isomerase [Aliiruegeria haliotis]